VSLFYVYLWTNLVNGKQYVGKGVGGRAHAHKWPGIRSILGVAMKKYGRENFELRYLATDLDEETAFAMERHAIQALETKAPYGYNRTDGGEGSAGRRVPEEERKRRSETMRLVWASRLGYRERVSAGGRGRTLSQEARAHLSPVS
jgi:group I intron endonuclease